MKIFSFSVSVLLIIFLIHDTAFKLVQGLTAPMLKNFKYQISIEEHVEMIYKQFE